MYSAGFVNEETSVSVVALAMHIYVFRGWSLYNILSNVILLNNFMDFKQSPYTMQ